MIIYAAIARASDAAVLVECCDPLLKGNAALVTSMLMQHMRDNPELAPGDARQTFIQRNSNDIDSFDFFFSNFIEACSTALGEDVVEENYFHFYSKAGVFYCCIGDDPDPKDQKVNFAYLDHVQKEFTRTYKPSRIARSNAYSLDSMFKPTMRSAMHHYNVNHDKLARDEKVQALLARVDDMKSVMGRNINLLMERGEKFDHLVQKSDALVEDAQIFKKRARIIDRKRKRKTCMTRAICGSLICIMILVLLFSAVIGICGVGLTYCRAKASVVVDALNGSDDAVN